MTAKFDQWLEGELGRTLTPIVSQPARPGQARYQVTRTHGISIGRKAVVSLVAATMTLGASAVLATASGSLNPQAWGQLVSSAVEQCKTDLQPGLHGIGACVSAFARHHGQQMQTQHGANGAAGQKHGGNHPGPPSLRQQASPDVSSTP